MKKTTHILNWYLKHAKQAATESIAKWLVIDQSYTELCFVAKLDDLANIPKENIEHLKGKK